MRALQILILDAVPSSTEATKSQKLPAASLQFLHNCFQPWASQEFSPSMWGWVKTYEITIFWGNERPFTTYFNVHQGTWVLISSHMRVPQILTVGIWHSPQDIIGIEARAFKFSVLAPLWKIPHLEKRLRDPQASADDCWTWGDGESCLHACCLFLWQRTSSAEDKLKNVQFVSFHLHPSAVGFIKGPGKWFDL